MKTVTSPPSNEKKSSQPTRSQARFAFAILLTINILNYADRSVLAAIQPKLQIEFHLTNTELGLLSSSFLLIYAIGTLPLGIWADRSVRKNIVALCVGVWSVATALTGFTANFIQIFIARSFLGVGEAGYAPASLSLIGDYFSKERRGRVLSLWSIGNLIGTALGLILGGIIADAFGWRWAFYVVGIPGLLAAFLIWRTVEPRRGASENDAGEEDDADDAAQMHVDKDFWQIARRILHIPTYWILLGAFVFSFFTIGSAQTWITTYMVRDFGLSVARAGIYSGVVLAGGSLVGTMIGGFVADFLQRRIPQGRLLVATFAFLVGAPLTLIALTLHDLRTFLGIFIAAILCLSLSLGPLNAVIQDVIAPEIRATAAGLILLLAHLLGDAASPLIVGAIADHTSLGFALLVTAPTCLFVAGIICLIGLRTVANDMRAQQRQARRR